MDREPKERSDEQVYQENKDDAHVNVVYSSPGTEDDGVSNVDVDEASAESFPGSDPPTTSSSAAVPKPDAGGKDD